MGYIQPKPYTKKNGESFIIRTAHPEDAEKVITFLNETIKESPYLLITEEEFNVSHEQEMSMLQKLLDDKGKIALIAEANGEVIGFLDFHNGNRNRNKHQGSFGMSVSKISRNQGIGKALLSELLQWATGNPLIEKVCLDVFSVNTHAIYLYEKLGFIKEGYKFKAIKINDDTYYDLISMAIFTRDLSLLPKN